MCLRPVLGWERKKKSPINYYLFCITDVSTTSTVLFWTKQNWFWEVKLQVLKMLVGGWLMSLVNYCAFNETKTNKFILQKCKNKKWVKPKTLFISLTGVLLGSLGNVVSHHHRCGPRNIPNGSSHCDCLKRLIWGIMCVCMCLWVCTLAPSLFNSSITLSSSARGLQGLALWAPEMRSSVYVH